MIIKPPKFYITGNCEDGTMYYEGNSCWGFNRYEAARFFTKAYAEKACQSVRAITGDFMFNIKIREIQT